MGPWLTVVGVAPDTRMQGPYDGQSDGAGIFQPLAQAPQRWITIVVRGHGSAPVTWAEPLRQAMARVDRNLPVYMVDTAASLIDATLAQNRLLASLFSIFGGGAMLLAAVGLYGVMSFAVSQRTNEYGIRMALGADTRLILQMILREGAMQLLLGLALGLSLAIVLVIVGDALMENFLFQVSRADPLVWGSTIVLLTLVTLLACLAPALRATKVNPVEALRAE
jgi:ABC-type antimicrobial peptide transport system permease subunit